jgi:purine-binding chemotaxis protein CheW
VSPRRTGTGGGSSDFGAPELPSIPSGPLVRPGGGTGTVSSTATSWAQRDLPLATEEAYYRSLAERSREKPQIELLTFMLGEQEYALGIRLLREIIRMPRVTPVPRVVPFVLGVISLRGGIVPVVDLRVRLRLPPAPDPPPGLAGLPGNASRRILVVSRDGESFGLLVDRVKHVVRMPAGEIEPPPAGLSGVELEFLHGLGRYRDRLIILLDLDPVLAFRAEEGGST